MGLPLCHPCLIARLTQGFAPPLSGVPYIEALCPTVYTDDAGFDHASRFLMNNSVNEHQGAASQGVGMGAQEGCRSLMGCLTTCKEQRFQHGQRRGRKVDGIASREWDWRGVDVVQWRHN